LNKLLAKKPNSIFDIISKDFFKEDLGLPQHDKYLYSGNYYEIYYALSAYYNPKSILEIGVRRGYSLISLIAGSDDVEYAEGWDIPHHRNQNYVDNCLDGLDEKIKQFTSKEVSINLQYRNSQGIEKMERQFDLIHVDGAHERLDKIHDLNLIKDACKVVIIDDYKCHIVGPACDFFVQQNLDIIENIHNIDSMFGTLILEFK